MENREMDLQDRYARLDTYRAEGQTSAQSVAVAMARRCSMLASDKMAPGTRIVTLLGRKGVLVAVERVWLTVVFDDQPEWPQCFHAFDKWIQAAQ
jgi:hypothetical protein